MTDTKERNRSVKEEERGGGNGTPVESGTGAIGGFGSFFVCGRFGPGDLAVACVEENPGMFLDAGVTEMEFFEAADVIDDVVDEKKLERF